MDGSQGAAGAAELQWYALRTLPTREQMTAKILRNFGLIAEVKTENRLRRTSKVDRERKVISYVAAPGYLFAASPADRPFPWRDAFKLHLVRSVIAINGAPARLDHRAVVSFLNYDEGSEPEYMRFHKTGREFQIGDSVIVNTGPFRDFRLCVEDIQDGEAHFIVSLLGKEQRLKVSVHDCIASEAA